VPLVYQWIFWDAGRAQAFCTMKAGFKLQVDTGVGDEMRVVQLTPAGSACSIGFGTGSPKRHRLGAGPAWSFPTSSPRVLNSHGAGRTSARCDISSAQSGVGVIWLASWCSAGGPTMPATVREGHATTGSEERTQCGCCGWPGWGSLQRYAAMVPFLAGRASRSSPITRGPVPLFEVDDAGQAAAEMAAAGAEVVGSPDSDADWTWIHVRGPDGNLYEFASRRRPPASLQRATPGTAGRPGGT
jgi:hypothetical protein